MPTIFDQKIVFQLKPNSDRVLSFDSEYKSQSGNSVVKVTCGRLNFKLWSSIIIYRPPIKYTTHRKQRRASWNLFFWVPIVIVYMIKIIRRVPSCSLKGHLKNWFWSIWWTVFTEHPTSDLQLTNSNSTYFDLSEFFWPVHNGLFLPWNLIMVRLSLYLIEKLDSFV